MPMLFKYFDEIDTNKDGKITKDEVTRMENAHANRALGTMKRTSKFRELSHQTRPVSAGLLFLS